MRVNSENIKAWIKKLELVWAGWFVMQINQTPGAKVQQRKLLCQNLREMKYSLSYPKQRNYYSTPLNKRVIDRFNELFFHNIYGKLVKYSLIKVNLEGSNLIEERYYV